MLKLNETLDLSYLKEKYDKYAKAIMANKQIIANILVDYIPDFKNMTINEVIKYIEHNPIEDEKDEYQLLDSKIRGYNSDDNRINNGMIMYDLLFYVISPKSKRKILINIEIQNGNHQGYHLYNRELYYSSRMITSQKDKEFFYQNYDDICNCYSIWLLLNTPTCFTSQSQMNYSSCIGKPCTKIISDKMVIIEIGLSDIISCDIQNKSYYQLHTIFISKISLEEKIALLQKYGIIISEEMKQGVDHMCEAANSLCEKTLLIGRQEGLFEGRQEGLLEGRQEGLLEGVQRTIVSMYRNGIVLELIAKCTDKTIEEVENIINQATLLQ